MSQAEKPRVPLAEIRTTAAWGLLTPKQAVFCERYIQSGVDSEVYDVQAAMKAAYSASSERNLKCLTYEVLANHRVREVLAIHFNQSARDLFLEELEKSISREKGPAKIQAQKLYAKIAFGAEDSEPSAAKGEPAVERIVTQGDGRYRITAVRIGDATSEEKTSEQTI
jgi:phage terminase small subunit